ncbi:NADH oxidoreductase hcr [Yersinia rohdei]|uniref:HCP oxidoreductase n=1 Tax=Yersinia rohdei TaxID=29485 RepID=A0A0U1HN70_YERRO|nr:NADH oxidoreductase [Yersinia rohdei]AJJ11519.1 NADH oxidoreductase hcr [Yersinia rohdei]MDN0096037.1 NADH oxidoreductase [Yersinia rohdei]CNE20746.1 HCP oxidoreductase [Yersinia rohdei]CNI57103.1 HCP oxidoreductase [Yersinia rohdei]CQI87908.1 HCP oxidoreductase [Yersinia rohdei]
MTDFIPTDCPTPLCPNRMQVHSIEQETPDVWSLRLINHDFYPYLPGQFALVSIRNSDETLRAYTLSSTPGLSPFIQLTVRCLADGAGSRWLTQQVKEGDYLWLSDAQGEFTCANHTDDHYLMLAAGCGVTPVMSMCRDLLARPTPVDIRVIFNVRSPADVIFAHEWHSLLQRYPQQLHLTLMAESEATAGFIAGRINEQVMQQVAPDINCRRVMTCGPAPYMAWVAQYCREQSVPADHFQQEQFRSADEAIDNSNELTMTISHPLRQVKVPVGTSLLFALEQHQVPVMAACRAGVCGSCKTRILHGEYTTTSTMTLTPAEIAQGYVLACSCQLQGDVQLA